MFYEKKWCKKCGSKLHKWGSNSSGSPRFRCTSCKLIQTRRRADISIGNHRKLFVRWLLGKLELSAYATKYGVTRQTLYNWFQPFWSEEPVPKKVDIRNKVLVIDGKYVSFTATVLIVATLEKVVSWSFTYRENSQTWYTFLSQLHQTPFAICCDGQRGMIKAIKTLFPSVIIQRCQFHVMQYCLAKLTQHPEGIAAIELRSLVLKISKIKTKDQCKDWLIDYIGWRNTYQSYLKERTYQLDSITPTGRHKWHYTHGRLHAAHSHLKNALPNLFKYLLYPQIPNTTNYVEGAINSPMQQALRNHRGLTLGQRRVLIGHFLAQKQ